MSYLHKFDTDGGSTGSAPLGVAYLAASVKHAGHRVTVIDALGEAPTQVREYPGLPLNIIGLTASDIIARIPADTVLIGFSVMFSSDWLVHKEVVRAVHAAFPHVPIVIGGEHATADADYILRHEPHVAACVLGEGEETLLELIDAAREGRDFSGIAGLQTRDPETGASVRTAQRKRMRQLDEIPWPAWEEVPLEFYLGKGGNYGESRGRVMPMLASRGCPYACTFCSNPAMWGRLWNVRSPEDVLAEVRAHIARYNIDSFCFYDATTIVKKSWILDFSRLLREANLGLRWSMPSGTRSEALDDEVLTSLRLSGCPKISYAPESGSPETLKRIDKRISLDRMTESIRAAVRNGIIVKVHIIMGFPFETRRGILEDYLFLLKLAWIGVSDVPVYIFHPYPGCALHDEIRARGGFPPEGEAYERFLAMSYSSNFGKVRSWSEHISDRQLGWYSMGGMALFYGCQFLFRPWRILQSIHRLSTVGPVTMYERLPDVMYSKIARRVNLALGRPGPGGAPRNPSEPAELVVPAAKEPATRSGN